MEWKTEYKQIISRLALCGGAAAAALRGAEKLPALEPYQPWLEGHKLEAGVVLAAALLGLSLLVFPLPEGRSDEDEPDPCDGYSPVD